MSENIKSRKYYRVHNGESWDRMHFVTDANSVDANDGDNMETKVGAIKGITTSTEVTEEGYAADATTVAALNSSLEANDGLKFRFTTDGEGRYGFLGADDSFIPFKSDETYLLEINISNKLRAGNYVDTTGNAYIKDSNGETLYTCKANFTIDTGGNIYTDRNGSSKTTSKTITL